MKTARDVILITKSAPLDEIRASARDSTEAMAEDVMARLAEGRTTLEELIRVLPYSSVYQFRQLAAGALADSRGRGAKLRRMTRPVTGARHTVPGPSRRR